MKLATISFLREANVYNIDNIINGHSVKQYLQSQLKDITDPTVAKVLANKLQAFIVNGDTNLQQLTKLPSNAPDWAHRALQTGQLMVFTPSPDLDDVVSNIAHYAQKAIMDIKSPDNNIVVRARQELHGLNKVQNMEILNQKANHYFAIGSKQQARDTEGMTAEQQYQDWIWYKLDTPEAFQREGKILQNCIGTHWTHQKCIAQNNTIYVLRTPSNESVVAIRVEGKDIIEIKGKNNKPPVEKYMPYVFSFVKDSDIKLTSASAKNELRNAGYWVFGEKLIVPLEKALNMYYDSSTNKLHRLDSDDTVVLSGYKFESFTNKDAIAHIREIVYRRSFDDIPKKILKGSIGQSVILFTISQNGELQIPTSANTGANVNTPELKHLVIKPMIELAKKEKVSLHPNIPIVYGITSTTPFAPITDNIKSLGNVNGFDKFSVSKLNSLDAWVASSLFIEGGKGPTTNIWLNPNDYPKLSAKFDFSRTHVMYRSYTPDGHNAFVLYVDSNNSVFCITTPYKISSRQLDPVRKLIELEKLTLEKSATTSSDIVIVPPSTIMSKKEFIAKKMEAQTSFHAEIEFEDGAKFKKLTGKELTNWLDQVSAGTNTQAVYMLYIDDTPMLAVPVHKNNITGIFAADYRHNMWRERDNERRGITPLPNVKTLDFAYGPYVKSLAKKLGLSINTKHLTLEPNKKISDMLQFIANNPGRPRSKAFQAAHVSAQAAPGSDAPYNMLDRPLIQLGLITQHPNPSRKGSIVLTPTQLGKDTAAKLERGVSVPMFDLIHKYAPVKGGDELLPAIAPPISQPKDPNTATQQPVERRERRMGVADEEGGSKTQRIYNLFVRMTDDNDGNMPSRGDFMRIIMEPPYNMTKAGASTYHYNMKTKYLQQHGQLGESFTFKEWLIAMV
ncbi:MAG: PcfJ domain-containing protein [Nitrososphaeraceae archaeon]